MKAVVIKKPHYLVVRDLPRPKPRPDEVLVKVAACGICGSDIRYFHGDNPWAKQTLGEWRENPPNMPLGHEFAGTIAEVGEESLQYRLGQRVAVLAYKGCGECSYCRAGNHHLCGSVRHIGHSAGWEDEEWNPAGMGEYCRVWSEMAFNLPGTITFEQATLLDGLAVSIHACMQGRIGLGSSALIIGTGAIGLLILQVARLSGARRAVCCDKQTGPLSIARELGADSCLQVSENRKLSDLDIQNSDARFDVVFDCIGSSETVLGGLQLLRRGGRLVAMALSADRFQLPATLLSGERSLTTSANNGYAEFQTAMGLMVSGKVRVDPLITHRFPLSEAAKAFEVAEDKDRYNAIKVIVQP